MNGTRFSKISQSVNFLGEYLSALENDSLGKHDKCKPSLKNKTEEQFYNLAEKFNQKKFNIDNGVSVC